MDNTKGLGMPLVANTKSVGAWDGIQEKFIRRLTLWKRQHICEGGGIVFDQKHFVGFASLFYVILHLPRMVKLGLEQIQRISFVRGIFGW